MSHLTPARMIQAMRDNDADFDGHFWVGVHSTGIYCLPSCRARQPRLENVIFYRSREEAVTAGLRGCKRCRSEFYPRTEPDWFHAVLEVLNHDLTRRIDENELSARTGVDATTIRRYFRAYLETSPASYHRRLRLNRARTLLQKGADILDVGYSCGFESASGFRSAFVRNFGFPPGKERRNRLSERENQTWIEIP
ncbi:MAG TPA: Ada metal-binding domain-containing protein [Thermoanaerobaculia bacterium]|nr:Ada metal-binding domain-containing protein [Thermoanaerobaculia bacterium]HUM29808.1 Ada metal-binding domain-containing protein [Thermoanaerobaculia bacterium]HXK68083.1 Ada metal-binding domain-containing protein [Thermoanaerobaculia bacterium]